MKRDNDLYVRITLFAIISVGFLLRINHWFDFLGADEIGKTGLMTWSWDFHKDPFPVHYYPPFFLYLNFVFSFVLKKLVIFLGIIDFNNIFQNTDFGFIFTLKTGRLLSAIFGTINIYMVFLIGKRFFDRFAGLTAALILAVFWPHVIDSHNFKSDVLLTLLITVTFYYALKFFRSKRTGLLMLSSFLLGLSIATKFNGVFFGLVLLIPLFYIRKEYAVIKGFFYIAVGGVLGFFAGAPNWLVHPVSNVKITLKYLKRLTEELVWYDQFPSSFILYGKNILEHFGILLIIIFICGVITAFVYKNRESVIIVISLLVYFILASRENYLNYRAILPLIPLMAVVIGKFIFLDIKELLANVRIRRIATGLLLIPVVVYSAGNFNRSYKSFDLLKGIASHPVRERAGIGDPDYSSYYMKNHFNRSSLIFREMWTPPAIGFKGAVFGKDVTRVPQRLFLGNRQFDFLVTSFSTDYILRKSKNKDFIDAAKKRLKNFVIFYKVDRPAIFTWSDDIQFWYRRPEYVKGNFSADKGIILPRNFVPLTKNPSVFLPLQRYEKDPCYGVINNGISGKFIFSHKRIKKIAFNYIANDKLKLIFDVNGKKVISTTGKDEFTGYTEVVGPIPQIFRDTVIRRLYETVIDPDELGVGFYIYKIEIKANTRITIPFTFKAKFENEGYVGDEAEETTQVPKEDIPELFSKVKAPEWVRSFFRNTGVDISLLSYINNLEVYNNKSDSIDDVATEYFPVGSGCFNINIFTDKIVKGQRAGNDAELKMIFVSGRNKESMTINVSEGKTRMDLDFKHKGGFIRIFSSGTRGANLIIKKITLVPDFKKYYNYSGSKK